MSTILIIVVIIPPFGGGGGYYAHGRYGRRTGGVLGLVVLVLVLLWLFGSLAEFSFLGRSMERWTYERRAGSSITRGGYDMLTGIETRLKASRVLLVEDNVPIRMLCAEALSEMGHTVCAVVATEFDAVSAAAQHEPDLMIVDASLDEGSGVSAVEKILHPGSSRTYL